MEATPVAEANDIAPEQADIYDGGFNVEVWVGGRPLEEYVARGRRCVEALEGAEYELRIRNPLGERVAVALSVDGLNTINTRNPDIEKEAARREREAQPETLSDERNRNTQKLVDQNPSLKDFYNTYDEFRATEREREEFQKYLATLSDRERELLSSGLNLYVVNLKNVGGLVMPVILQIDYMDGTSEELRIPAEIWRHNNSDASKLIVTKKEIKAITLDPHLETADVDVENNYFPRRPVKQKFQIYKEPPTRNPMQELERKPIPESQTQP